jgi:hypothetical protein
MIVKLLHAGKNGVFHVFRDSMFTKDLLELRRFGTKSSVHEVLNFHIHFHYRKDKYKVPVSKK